MAGPSVAQVPPISGVLQHGAAVKRKQILLNAFDMCSVGHLSPGQWKNPTDRSNTKQDIQYWIDLAKLLDSGGFNALLLADTYSTYTKYEGGPDNSIRRATQWPVADPSIPISAMAAVTTNLAFVVTSSTSLEPPFVHAKRFSTLDHFTRGRIGWNIVTASNRPSFRDIGLGNLVAPGDSSAQADEYLRVLYKLWEGSWADDAVSPDPEADIYVNPDKVRVVHHRGKFYSLDARHIVAPSPQRTPFLFQAGLTPTGTNFAATHAEGISVSARAPSLLKPTVDDIRSQAESLGRDPQSIKFFANFTPIVGRTDEEARAKHEEAKRYASTVGGLVLASGWTGIDLSRIPLDQDIMSCNSFEAHKLRRVLDAFQTDGHEPVSCWTPRIIAERAAIGGLSPVCVGSPQTVADEMERWIREGDVDGFNIGHVTTPGTFYDVIELLIPELQRRGLYPELPLHGSQEQGLTAREKVYGRGQSRLRSDHPGSRYKYNVYQGDYEDERSSDMGA